MREFSTKNLSAHRNVFQDRVFKTSNMTETRQNTPTTHHMISWPLFFNAIELENTSFRTYISFVHLHVWFSQLTC